MCCGEMAGAANNVAEERISKCTIFGRAVDQVMTMRETSLPFAPDVTPWLMLRVLNEIANSMNRAPENSAGESQYLQKNRMSHSAVQVQVHSLSSASVCNSLHLSNEIAGTTPQSRKRLRTFYSYLYLPRRLYPRTFISLRYELCASSLKSVLVK